MVSHCCICKVEKGTSQDYCFTYHRFPKIEDFKLKWWKAIGKKVHRNAKVCSKHFKAKDYKNYEDRHLIRKILKPTAVPSLYMKLGEKYVPPIYHFFVDVDNIKTENQNIEGLQIDGSSILTNIDNPTNIDDPLNIDNPTNIDNLTNNTTLDNKARLCSTVNQTKESIIPSSTLKLLKKQRYQNSILGIIRKEDFVNEDAWLSFHKYINKIRKKYKVLENKNQRLRYAISSFKELLKKQLEEADDILEIQEIS